MKKIRTGFMILIIAVLGSCNMHHQAKTDDKDAGQKTINVKVVELASNQDLVCGMKMEDGHIGDTTMYQGKIYGFCSPECKAEFLKNPQSHLTQK